MIDKRISVRKAQIERTLGPRTNQIDGVMAESETFRQPGTPNLNSSLPPKPVTSSEVTKPVASAKPAATVEPPPTEKEKLFQRDPKIQVLDGVNPLIKWSSP
jgi:hypothetical protein